jgi:uncharacterized NAD(P)/FAD-binding protein YdhS
MPILTTDKQDITIIGGGCSGALLLLQLLKSATDRLSVTIINTRYPFLRGIAYNTDHEEHLLNVRAGRMSADPDDQQHFVNWLLSKPEYHNRYSKNTEELFIPRIIYGKYLEETVAFALSTKPASFSYRHFDDEAIDLLPEADGYQVVLKQGVTFSSSKIALCTGNHAPINIPGLKNQISDSRIYLNPWAPECLESFNPHQPILIVGTSLTMADIVMTLAYHSFPGKIYAISRHGELPNEHPVVRTHIQREEDFLPEKSIENLYRQVKQRIRAVLSKGYWQEPILEDIRPHTQLLWQQFSLPEKQRFLRHLNHKWSKIRHRLPSEVHSKIRDMVHTGQLTLIAGGLDNIHAGSQSLTVTFHERNSESTKTVVVQRVINCTGPEGNIGKSDRILPHQLMKSGLIRPCPMKLGYDATADGKLINREGDITKNIWTMGPGLRGVLWESTAVPEIRVQAKALAKQLLDSAA